MGEHCRRFLHVRRRPRGERDVLKVYEARMAAVEAVESRPEDCPIHVPLLDRRRQKLVKVDEPCENKRQVQELRGVFLAKFPQTRHRPVML